MGGVMSHIRFLGGVGSERAVVLGPLETAFGNSHWNVRGEPMLARNLFSGREGHPRNSREGTLQQAHN